MRLKRQEVQNNISIFAHIINRNTDENVLRRAKIGQSIQYDAVVSGYFQFVSTCGNKEVYHEANRDLGVKKQNNVLKEGWSFGRVITSNKQMINLVLRTSVA